MSPPKTSQAPRLVLTANLWTLAAHPSPAREWSLARKIEAVAEAGFDAVTAPASEELGGLLSRHGLRYLGFFSSSDRREFRAALSAQRAAGADVVNVQLGDDFTSTATATRLAVALLREAERQGVYAAIETHRDTATETPEKTYALAAAYRRATARLLPITWDHSHFAVVKHLKPFLYAPVLLRSRRLIQQARLFHLRPFNGQHAQVPVNDPRGRLTPEFKTWLGFAEELMRQWLAGPRPGGEFWACPEIGPVGIHGYNLSTHPPSWAQAQVCGEHLRRVWRRLVREAARR